MKKVLKILVVSTILVLIVGLGWYFGNKNKKVDNNLNIVNQEIIDQEIGGFLKREENYSDEKIVEMVLMTDLAKQKETKLGLVSKTNNRIEGMLIDYIRSDDYILLLVGMEGKDGSRLITGLAIPMYYYKGVGAKFYVEKFLDRSVVSEFNNVYKGSDETTILGYLDQLKGKPVIFDSLVTEFPKEWMEGKYATENNGVVARLAKEEISKVSMAKKLVVELWQNGIIPENVDGIPKDTKVVTINSIDDIKKIEMNKIPIVMKLFYF